MWSIEYFPVTAADDKLVVVNGFVSKEEAEKYVVDSLNSDVDDLMIYESEAV
jgi:hypothetical protein